MLRGREAGLAFVEMLIAIALMSVVVLTFYQLIAVAVRGWGAIEGQMEVQQQPRIALARVGAEVRQARDFVIGAGGRDLGLAKATILVQDAAAGSTAIEVEDASSLVPGMPLVIQSLTRLERAGVVSVTGTTVTLSAGLARTHRRGEAVLRARTALSADAFAGLTGILVEDGSVLRPGDLVGVGDEGPHTVAAVAGNAVTLAAPLAQGHAVGAVVQPLAVLFRCEGACLDPASQLTRCTAGCETAGNRIPLADLLGAPAGRPLFAAVSSTLASSTGVGSTTICPVAAAGFSVEDRIQIGREVHTTSGAEVAERRTVAAIAAGCLTLDRGLDRPHPAGTVVRVSAVELAVRAFRVNDAIGGQLQEVIVTTKAGLRN